MTRIWGKELWMEVYTKSIYLGLLVWGKSIASQFTHTDHCIYNII